VIANQLEAANRLPETIQVYEEITRIRTMPLDQLIAHRLKLASLYEKNGQKAEAIAQYRAVRQADPKNVTAEEALKRLGG
jgi:hypothetical protein